MRKASKLLKALVHIAALLTILSLFFIILFILVKGVSFLNPSMFEWTYNSTNISMMPAIINTFIMVALSLAVAVPLGVLTAVYMIEYANKDNILVQIVQVTSDTLAGIPSIVYGLFGMLFFVIFLEWNYSILAGSMTLAIMVLPLIMRSTEDALLAVPKSYREGSFGLGAGKVRTIFQVVLPSAMPGILAGVILATGRIVGETAALLYTSGTVAEVPSNIVGSAASGRTLALHMYVLSNEGLHVEAAYATGVILLIIVLILNFISTQFAQKLGGVQSNG